MDRSNLKVNFPMISGIKTAAGRLLEPVGLGVAGGDFAPIIEGNSILPVEIKKVFSTSGDDQRSIEFDVYRGKGKKTQDCTHIGHCIISGLPSGKRGEPQVEVTFSIDRHGIFEVKAELKKGFGGPADPSKEMWNRIVFEKNGERMEFSSMDEMPPEIRREFEEMRAKIDNLGMGIPSDEGYYKKEVMESHHKNGLRYQRGDGYYKKKDESYFIHKRKKYHNINEIEDERARMVYSALVNQVDAGYSNASESTARHSSSPNKLEDKTETRQTWCPECGNQIIPKKTFTGKNKCPECKAKWKEEETAW